MFLVLFLALPPVIVQQMQYYYVPCEPFDVTNRP